MADLTTTEVAAELRVCESSVLRWAKAGRFPGAYNLKGSAGWRFPHDSLNRFRNGGRRPRSKPPPSGLSIRQQREQN